MRLKERDKFILVSDYEPKGDQPQAIEKLVTGLRKGLRFQTLLGVTGSGKTYTMAQVIARVNRPTLVLSHNKTLAAQLYSEFRDLFPYNAVEYFVSYYDYYQPEAYVPQSDLYIEKDADINEDIVKLRHKTLRSLMERRDVIVVSSVSCIYGWDDPTEFLKGLITIKVGDRVDRRSFVRDLIVLQYERNDIDFSRGKIRVRGDTVDVFPTEMDVAVRIEFFGDEVESISLIDPLLGTKIEERESFVFFPAKQFLTTEERIKKAVESIRRELKERVEYFKRKGKYLEAERLLQRTNFDIEMLLETGYCKGIENYTRHFSGRKPGEPPYTILDYFPEDYITFIDESHITVPQVRGMYLGDRSRKETLVEYGFRLPSALDNRPLKFDEFLERVNQVIFVSATPSDYELSVSEQVVEQLIRPTGLVDPMVEVRPTENQIEDLINEIKKRVEKNERVLVTTLTKRMAEDLTEYLIERGLKVKYLHSDIDTIKRAEILRELRAGEFDCLVGINLLREGLDLPEVSLVAILDADKEGFLRSYVSLIQTIGRAARNVSGKVIMYADNITESMRKAIDETNRRRKIQMEYNKKHGIKPETIRKAVKDLIDLPYKGKEEIEEFARVSRGNLSHEEINYLIMELEEEMHLKAETLEFEEAARIRDKIFELKKLLKRKEKR
ncbi:MAG: excinuclease ABC subunit UvrB [Caldisericia bacterium]|nr:excinuclease ABC subunit UvrB [Caldisericia bacterium]